NYIVVILRALARKNPADSSKSWIASHSLAMTTQLQNYLIPRPWWERGRERGQKAAFTLAETLITLGIIGVVAAITIPGLLTAYRRIAYPMQLKAIYSKLLVAQKTINDEFGTPDQWSFNKSSDDNENLNDEIFNRYVKELNPSTYLGRFGNYYKKILYFPTSVSFLNGKLESGSIPGWFVGRMYEPGYFRAMQLKNGATIAFFIASSPGGANFWNLILRGDYAAFLIDINGKSKPNTLGRDIFAFSLKGGSNSIVPYMSNTDDCNKNGVGLSCTRKIMEDGWKMNY
ncbi:MAG: type II secretion system GspH family protein, partial [Muribaculaceae bacterium]|nr:type II secretion system GspH family protein [Muribaculaceae bacterium]